MSFQRIAYYFGSIHNSEGGLLLNKAKLVMFIYSLAALISMIGIGFSASLVFLAGTDEYDMMGYLGAFACFIAMGVIFMLGMKQKKKFIKAGLL